MQNAWYNTSFVIQVNLLEKLGLKIKYIYELWNLKNDVNTIFNASK